MALPLTPAQQKAVDALVRSGALRAVRPDEKKARAFLAGAESALADVPNVTRTENRYNLAYKAAHDVGEAVLAGYGYKTTYGAGGHVKVGRFLAAIFDTPPPYDVLRARFAQEWRAGESAWSPEARAIFAELGLSEGSPSRRSLVDSETFRALMAGASDVLPRAA